MTFRENLILMLLEKGALALLGAAFAFVAARALERYKRNQAVTLELGKARAGAFLRVLSCLSTCDLLVARLSLEAEQPGSRSEKRGELLEKLKVGLTRLWDQLAVDFVLLDEDMGVNVLRYQQALTASYLVILKGGSAREGREAEALDEARQSLARFLPALRPPD